MFGVYKSPSKYSENYLLQHFNKTFEDIEWEMNLSESLTDELVYVGE